MIDFLKVFVFIFKLFYFICFCLELSLENRSISNTETDQEEIDLPRISDYIQANRLTPTVTSRRIRQDSSCSSTNSLRYTESVLF